MVDIQTYIFVFAVLNIVLLVIAAILILRYHEESESPEASATATSGEEAGPAPEPAVIARPEVVSPSAPQPSGDKEIPWPMVPLTLVEASDPARFWRIAVASGMERSKILVLAPDSPAVVTGKYGLAGAKVWRITRTEGDENVNPSDLEKIGYLIEKHLEQGAGRAVLVHGLGRLIDSSGFRNTRRLVDVAKESAETNRGAILAFIDPVTIEPAQLRQLEEGASVIRI
jgi:hypothetical protein